MNEASLGEWTRRDSTPPISESGRFRFRCVLFDTNTGRVSGRFCPTFLSGQRTPSVLRRRRRERDTRALITKYIVYTDFLMIGLRWPAPAAVWSGFADPLVGMVIAATGQKHFRPGCDLHRGGKDGRPGKKSPKPSYRRIPDRGPGQAPVSRSTQKHWIPPNQVRGRLSQARNDKTDRKRLFT